MISNEVTDIFRAVDSVVTTSSSGTSNPRPSEVFSDFGDDSCGEPLLFHQHMSLDFTPNANIDTDFVQRKVCSFWQFIENTPEIQNLIVKPEKNPFGKDSNTLTKTPTSEAEPDNAMDVRSEETAVNMLEFMEDKQLTAHAFEAKMPESHCTLGQPENKECELSKPQRKKVKKKKPVCTCKGVCSSTFKSEYGKSSEEYESSLKMLSSELNEWDTKYPRSKEPPAHPPSLQQCFLQREMFPWKP